jgi:hypothetical protein
MKISLSGSMLQQRSSKNELYRPGSKEFWRVGLVKIETADRRDAPQGRQMVLPFGLWCLGTSFTII